MWVGTPWRVDIIQLRRWRDRNCAILAKQSSTLFSHLFNIGAVLYMLCGERDVVYQRLTGIGLHVRVLSARIIDIP